MIFDIIMLPEGFLYVLCGLLMLGVGLWQYYESKNSRFYRLTRNIPGPPSLPLLGNVLDFKPNTADFFHYLNKIIERYGPVTKMWLGSNVFIMLSDPRNIEVILGSSVHIEKSDMYKFSLPWLGTGLLTSTDSLWHKRRKIITPTFHFKILEGFVDVFNSNAQILVEELKKNVADKYVDIYNNISLCDLDIICETAMGVKVDAQTCGSSKYVIGIQDITSLIMLRGFRPWLHNDFIFSYSRIGRRQSEILTTVHGVIKSVIKKRKSELLNKNVTEKCDKKDNTDIGEKKHTAFLDMLILSSMEGHELTDLDICDEVNTFMFEGHDTMTSAICFALWCLAKNQDVQDMVLKEIESVVDCKDRALVYRDLQEMKYLEKVIKETLRMFPSVPFYGRKLNQDVQIDNYTLPKGSTVGIMAYNMHRNSKLYPDPEKFNPERFDSINLVQGRHPYQYIPFSAGPRNCIGQKFAMLAMKTILAKVVRCYKVLPSERSELKLKVDLILKSCNGIVLKLEQRVAHI